MSALSGLRPVLLVAALADGPLAAARLTRAVEDGETGLLVPPDDAGALAVAMQGLLADPADAESPPDAAATGAGAGATSATSITSAAPGGTLTGWRPASQPTAT